MLLLLVYGAVRQTGPAASRRGWTAWLLAFALIGLVAALTAGVQLLPTAELALQSDRAEQRYAFATALSMPPRSLVHFLMPWSGPVTGIFDADHRQLLSTSWTFAGYGGVLSLVLAALAVSERRQPAVRAMLVVLGVALVLMLGGHTPVYGWLLRALPGLGFFRAPARALLLAVWALTVLGAFGLQWLLAPDQERWRAGRWRLLAAGALFAALLCLSLPVVLLDLRQPVSDAYGFFYGWRRTLLSDADVFQPLTTILATLLALALLGRSSRRAAAALLSLVIATDVLATATPIPLARPSYRLPPLLQEALRESANDPRGPFRADLSGSFLDANLAMAARVENVNGYWPVALRRFFKYVHHQRGVKPPAFERHQLYDTLYRQDDPFRIPLLNVQWATLLAGDGAEGRLVRATTFLPRAWLVDRAEVIPGESATLDRLNEAGFDPARTVLLEKAAVLALAGSGTPPGQARVRILDDGSLDIAVHATDNAYLVLSEVFYPGWRAEVDGRDVALERADYLITALPLGPGEHRVLYRYDPVSFKLGAAATALVCLLALALAVKPAR